MHEMDENLHDVIYYKHMFLIQFHVITACHNEVQSTKRCTITGLLCIADNSV